MYHEEQNEADYKSWEADYEAENHNDQAAKFAEYLESQKQPFEYHPKLKELIEHAASNWKTDSKWSELLSEINKVCIALEVVQTLNKNENI